ncbi:hypothetical protein [Bdellovibrio reynosensis]|uniref:FecR protein domain-containing protein n=1 Tax=Bdellovibrio reynosensis TaxID=2835041 RepID=A0ABY4C5D3_9BACT|nr:hypothetical protein [Bdellovibrio reynosensis]UOF00171.1 hypothetical protein MNR06_10705 [Bdellovibrio reynosensis]
MSLFLAKDYLFHSQGDESALGVPLAEVKELSNELKFKHSSAVFWAEAQKNQKLFNGTEVFTGVNSNAMIEMKNKNRIHVPEETLLRISEDATAPGGLALNLDKGSLQIIGGGVGKGLKLRIAGNDLELSGNESFGLFLKKDDVGVLTLSVSSGSLELKSGDTKRVLSVGEAIKVESPSETKSDSEVPSSKPAKIEIAEVVNEKIQLLNPPHQKVLYGQGLEFFKWQPQEEAKITLEYSSSPDFLTDLVRMDVTGLSETVIPKELKPGQYYWRIIAVKNNIPQFSEIRIFGVEILKGNEAGKPVLQFKERGKWQLTLPVKDAKFGEQFHFQVSRNSEFTNIFDEYQGPQPMKSLIDENGEFFIRLRKVYEGGHLSDWSAPVRLQVRAPLTSPELQKQPEFLNNSDQVEAKLTWTDVPFAVDYLIQLSETPKFGTIVKNVVVARSPYVLRHSLPQQTYMRVLARSSEGEYSLPSQAFKIKGLLKGPFLERKEVLPALYEKPETSPQLHLLWAHRDQSKKYRVEMSRDQKLANSQSYETDNVEFFKEVNEEGWYYFRVWSLGDTEKYLLAPTSILAVSFSKPGNLITPKLVTPKNKEVFLVPKGVPVSIKFTWTESPHNEWYTLQLAQNPSFKNPIEHKIEGQEYVLKSAIKNGQWYFRVQGRNKYQASAWSETGVFYFGVSQ